MKTTVMNSDASFVMNNEAAYVHVSMDFQKSGQLSKADLSSMENEIVLLIRDKLESKGFTVTMKYGE